MDAGLRAKYEEHILGLMEELRKAAPGSEEQKALSEEIKNLQVAIIEDDKLTQQLYDSAQQRKLDAETAEKQAKSEKRKARLGFAGSILGFAASVVSIVGALMGLKSNQQFTLRCEDAGVYPDAKVHKTDPNVWKTK